MGIQKRITASLLARPIVFLDDSPIPLRASEMTARDYVIAMASNGVSDYRTPITPSMYSEEKACETARLPKYKTRKFRLWSYDVWGNARDGWDVNDRYGHGYVTIRCQRKTLNAGMPGQFHTWEPADRQLSRAAGVTRASWEGSDGLYTAEDSRNGKPLGELCEEE